MGTRSYGFHPEMGNHGDFHSLAHEWGIMRKNKRCYRVSTPPWHKVSLELKATKIRQMQEELFAPRPAGWRESSSYKDGPSPVPNQKENHPHHQRQGWHGGKSATEQTRHKKPDWPSASAVSLPHLTSPRSPNLLFAFFSSYCSTTYCPLLKRYLSFWVFFSFSFFSVEPLYLENFKY